MNLPIATPAIGYEGANWLMDICWLCKHDEGWNGFRYTIIKNKDLGLCTGCVRKLTG